MMRIYFCFKYYFGYLFGSILNVIFERESLNVFLVKCGVQVAHVKDRLTLSYRVHFIQLLLVLVIVWEQHQLQEHSHLLFVYVPVILLVWIRLVAWAFLRFEIGVEQGVDTLEISLEVIVNLLLKLLILIIFRKVVVMIFFTILFRSYTLSVF